MGYELGQKLLTDRTITLAINWRVTGAFPMTNGLPQGFSLSPILYLLYNVDLLSACNNSGKKASQIGFVDDTNILAFGQSTEANCRVLENVHNKCAEWAKRRGAEFTPAKYELIHLAKNPKKFNISGGKYRKLRHRVERQHTHIGIAGGHETEMGRSHQQSSSKNDDAKTSSI